MCERLWCISPVENAVTCQTSSRLMALPGTPCGYDKVGSLTFDCIILMKNGYTTGVKDRL